MSTLSVSIHNVSNGGQLPSTVQVAVGPHYAATTAKVTLIDEADGTPSSPIAAPYNSSTSYYEAPISSYYTPSHIYVVVATATDGTDYGSDTRTNTVAPGQGAAGEKCPS